MYKKRTSYFGIPYPSAGEKIQEEQEKKAANIIENQLLAGMKGIKCCVFEEGYFKLIDNNDGTFSVALIKDSSHYALCGVVGGGYVESKDPILWEGMKDGLTYYLYVQYSENLYADENDFRVVKTITKKIDDNGIFLLLAKVDLSKKEIDDFPDGKVYSNDIAKHVSDFINPHGDLLQQKELSITEVLTFKENAKIKSDKELTISDNRIEVNLSDIKNQELKTENKTLIGSINEIGEIKQKVSLIEFTKENLEKTISIDGEVIFVNTTVLYNGINFLDAKINVGMYSIDKSIESNNICKIYSDKEALVQIQVWYK